jgi:hypothetical protein
VEILSFVVINYIPTKVNGNMLSPTQHVLESEFSGLFLWIHDMLFYSFFSTCRAEFTKLPGTSMTGQGLDWEIR